MRLEEAQMTLEDGADELPTAEAEYRAIEQHLNGLTAQQANLSRDRDLSRQKLEHLRRGLEQLSSREDALRRELSDLNLPDQAQQQAAAAEVERARGADTVRARLVADEAKQADLAAEREKLDEQLAAARRTGARARPRPPPPGMLAREAASEQLDGWLQRQGLADAPQLWQSLQVEPSGDRRWRRRWGAPGRARRSLVGEPPPAALALADGGASGEWRPERPWPTLLQQVRAADAFCAGLARLAGRHLPG